MQPADIFISHAYSCLQVVCATPTDVEKLGSLLLCEIKAADTTGAPTLMQLITKLQVSCAAEPCH